mgnify:CR=1 FL=1
MELLLDYILQTYAYIYPPLICPTFYYHPSYLHTITIYKTKYTLTSPPTPSHTIITTYYPLYHYTYISRICLFMHAYSQYRLHTSLTGYSPPPYMPSKRIIVISYENILISPLTYYSPYILIYIAASKNV